MRDPHLTRTQPPGTCGLPARGVRGTLDEVPFLPERPALDAAVGLRADIRALGQQREAAARLVSLTYAEQKPTVDLAREVLSFADVSYQNGIISASD